MLGRLRSDHTVMEALPVIKLWGGGPRTLKVELVAAFADVAVEKPPFTFGVTNRTPWYLAMNPMGKVELRALRAPAVRSLILS